VDLKKGRNEMNERIRELAKKVGVSFGGHPMNALAIYDSELQKFAELIILECADFVAAGEFGDPGAARELKEYFGVEEKNT
jgi:hypothetical protein